MATSFSERNDVARGRGDTWLHRVLSAPVLALGVLLLLTVVIFWQQLFDHWTFPWDFVGGYSATPAFVAATFGRANFLSWSPFVASGFPVAVDPQAGLYFPGWWLLGALHVPLTLRAVTAVQIAHVLFGSVGVLLLARIRRLGWSWAVVAAVAYLFFGGFYGEAEHADIFRGFSYLPWLLWALTPPEREGRWLRIAVVPPLAWLVASGAYPGQIVSFAIAGLAYLVVALWIAGRDVLLRHRWALLLAAVSAGAVCAAVLLPYLRAERANELIRVLEPTAAVRAGASISPRDLLGLYLNNFAWTYDGTVTALCVGAPILIGVACARMSTLRRQAPLIASGSVALLLAMTPKIGVVGRAMVAARPLFPSRFPAADYKAAVAITLILVSADAWSQVASRQRSLPWRAAIAGCVLVVGALLAPTTFGHATYKLWLLILVIVACVALFAKRPSSRVMALLLVGLVAIDGAREITDYRLLGHISPWRASPAAAAPYRARDGDIRKLPALLKERPVSRPARVAPYASLTQSPTGSDPDASGWVADGYHMVDYGGTIERVLWQAEHNPDWSALLLAPWHGYTFPCAAVGCSDGAVRLPAAKTWSPSPSVRTLSYSAKGIVYSVNTSKPVLMVENELALAGWSSNSKRVSLVKAGIPLRTWRLSSGSYRFTASFHEPGRTFQDLVAVIALITWVACGFTLGGMRRLSSGRRLADLEIV
jgi:hypothetical protein